MLHSASISHYVLCIWGFAGGLAGKEFSCSVGDMSSIPRSGRSPGEENGCPPQYSGLENFMDCIVHGVTKSQTGLSDLHFHFLSFIEFVESELIISQTIWRSSLQVSFK